MAEHAKQAIEEQQQRSLILMASSEDSLYQLVSEYQTILY